VPFKSKLETPILEVSASTHEAKSIERLRRSVTASGGRPGNDGQRDSRVGSLFREQVVPLIFILVFNVA